MRRTLVLSALAALALGPQASAAPAVGAEDGAAATFALTTAAGQHYDVRVLASVPTKASTATVARVRVHVFDPDAKRSGDLPASGFTVDGSRSTLVTSLGGTPLRIVWTVSDYVVAASLGEASTDTEKADGWTIAGAGAVAQVTWGAVRCTTDATVVGKVLAHDTDSYGGPLAQRLGLNLKGARCAAPATTSVGPLP